MAQVGFGMPHCGNVFLCKATGGAHENPGFSKCHGSGTFPPTVPPDLI